MAWWLIALAAATVYLIWLSWVDARHHRPWVALSAALLAALYLGAFVALAVSPWITLPVIPTMFVFLTVEIVVRSLHRLASLGGVPLGPRYPIENP